jgi:AIPR protein
MITLEDFHYDFLQSILSDTESRGLMKPQAFFENVCEELVASGDLSNNYTVAEYTKKGLEIHGYDFDEERKILTLIVHQFFQDDEIQTLTKSQIDTKFNRLKRFFQFCIQGSYNEMEETAPEFSMAYNINQYFQRNQINKIRLMILTDGKMTNNLVDLPAERNEGILLEFRVVDIEYLYKIHISEYADKDFDIEVNLPYLAIDAGTEEYQSYLSVMSGKVLADIYEKHGQKLFEQNVRTFLQFKGGVNKGLKNTIEYNPDMFFAYNNGITATATDIKFNDENNISKIVNFQIVNGGQTTSAIYAANKNLKLDISKVSVQMKLSIVKEPDKQNDFVSKVSEYANTQNKVNKSDFFSNSPFHKEMKSYSKRLWVSTVKGSQRRTHWFYERARGEYLNEQLYLTKSEKNKFLLENPKNQFLDKTFLAKSEVSWMRKPNVVSKGAQYSFAYFADNVTKKLEDDSLAITENYFKDVVSRVILFKETEKLISNSSWYDGGFRAQTVTYSIAYLSYLVSKTGRFLNFNLIWDAQTLPAELTKLMENITESVYDEIVNPPTGTANVAQWCKQSSCWEKINQMYLTFPISESLLIAKEELNYTKKEDRKNKQLESGIEIQMFVVGKEKEFWEKLFSYFKKNEAISVISPTQMDILYKMSLGTLYLPSEKQSKILYQLFEKAEKEGFSLIS